MSGTKGHSGGKRAGAGRKPLTPGMLAIRRNVTLSHAANAVILAHKGAKGSYSATLDRIVREWAERHPTAPPLSPT